MHRTICLPEGMAPAFPPHQPLSALQEAKSNQTILTGTAVRCDRFRDLHVRFGGYEGVIPRNEAVHPDISGAQRDISILSLVGRSISFTIESISFDGAGRPVITLSRRAAQEKALNWLLAHAQVGCVLPARVTHLADFGAFVDLGCGVISLVPLDNLSVARVEHPSQRLHVGEDILVLVTRIDAEHSRFYLSHKELLGTWLQNAADFSPGDTVTGIVRAVREYGIFVELTRNLSGLAQWKPEIAVGDGVSVCIQSIRPETHKIKLQIIQKLDQAGVPLPPRYFITDGIVTDWAY